MLRYLIAGFVLCMLGFTNPESTRVRPVHKVALKASYQIDVPDVAYGSGFAVGHYQGGTLIITNDHVCQQTRGPGIFGKNSVFKRPLNTIKPVVINTEGSRWSASVIKTSGTSVPGLSKPAADLCLLLVQKEKLPIALISKQSAEIGEEVFSVSGPLGFFPLIHQGFVGPLVNLEDKQLLEAQAVGLNITHGSSGGAVFNTEGQVVGVIFALITDDESKVGGVAVMIPKVQLDSFLQKYLENKK